MDHTLRAVDKRLLFSEPGDEEIYNTQYEFRVGAGNATSKEEMQKIIPDLQKLDFRLTYKDGWVTIWVKEAEYKKLRDAKNQEQSKKSMDDFLKMAPLLYGIYAVMSVVVSAIVTIRVAIVGYLFSGLGAVSPLTAFLFTLAICAGVGLISFVYFILNKGKAE